MHRKKPKRVDGLGTPHRVKPSSCPYCGAELGAVSGFRVEAYPQPGDISLCIRCSAVLVFTADLGVRKPTTHELLTLEQDGIIREPLEVWQATFGFRFRQ